MFSYTYLHQQVLVVDTEVDGRHVTWWVLPQNRRVFQDLRRLGIPDWGHVARVDASPEHFPVRFEGFRHSLADSRRQFRLNVVVLPPLSDSDLSKAAGKALRRRHRHTPLSRRLPRRQAKTVLQQVHAQLKRAKCLRGGSRALRGYWLRQLESKLEGRR